MLFDTPRARVCPPPSTASCGKCTFRPPRPRLPQLPSLPPLRKALLLRATWHRCARTACDLQPGPPMKIVLLRSSVQDSNWAPWPRVTLTRAMLQARGHCRVKSVGKTWEHRPQGWVLSSSGPHGASAPFSEVPGSLGTRHRAPWPRCWHRLQEGVRAGVVLNNPALLEGG